MWLKKLLIWLIKNLLVIVFITLIFSSITLDFSKLLKGVFGDIFEYSSPEMQKEVTAKLADTCSSFGQNNNIQKEKTLMPDLGKIGAICQDYKSGKIDDKEFFFDVVSSPLSSEQIRSQNLEVLEKYNKIISYLNKNKIIYFVISAVLIILLYLLIMDFNLFLLEISKISFSLGILIMVPYLAAIAYDKFIGIDTTPILGSILGAGNIFNFKAVLSVILLMFLRTYNGFIITLGIMLLTVGIAGRVYGFALKRKNKKD